MQTQQNQPDKNSAPIYKILQEFGLTPPEISVYLANLEIGAQPASVIAKKANLKRGHTYNLLALLLQKGIVQKITKSGVTYFIGRQPATLLAMIRHREQDLKTLATKLHQIVPDLEKIRNPELVQPKVRFFQGIEGIKEIYEDTLRTPKQGIFAFTDFDYCFPENQDKNLYDWIWNYAKKRSAKKIPFWGIINKSPMSDFAFKKRKEHKRTLKMLKNTYLPAEINIYGDKVAFMSTSKDMVGLIIEDTHIAQTLKNLHKAMWELLPGYK